MLKTPAFNGSLPRVCCLIRQVSGFPTLKLFPRGLDGGHETVQLEDAVQDFRAVQAETKITDNGASDGKTEQASALVHLMNTRAGLARRLDGSLEPEYGRVQTIEDFLKVSSNYHCHAGVRLTAAS